MKTAVAETSIAQYRALRDSGSLAPKQFLILSKMRYGRNYSRRELAGLTGLETSCVAGRCNELLDRGLLETTGTMPCPITGKQVQALKLASEQQEMFSM